MKELSREKRILMSPFTLKVIALIRKIPKGKVATYGQIAKLAGKPHGSRGVGWILNACSKSHGLPWQRVLNSQGRISFPKGTKEAVMQKRLLEKEGVLFSGPLGLSLEKYQWKKKAPAPKVRGGSPRLFRD